MCHVRDLHTYTFENSILDDQFSRQKWLPNTENQNQCHGLNSNSLLIFYFFFFHLKIRQKKVCNSLCTFTVLKLLGTAMWLVTKVTIGQIRWWIKILMNHFCQRNTIAFKISKKDTKYNWRDLYFPSPSSPPSTGVISLKAMNGRCKSYNIKGHHCQRQAYFMQPPVFDCDSCLLQTDDTNSSFSL